MKLILWRDFLLELIWEKESDLVDAFVIPLKLVFRFIYIIYISRDNLDKVSKKGNNVISLNDLKIEPEEINMSNFLKIIVKWKICFKNPDKLTCIDFNLSNSTRSFQDACTFKTGHPDFHKLIIFALKLYFPYEN